MIQVINDTIQEAVSIVKRKKARNYKLQEPDYTAALAIELPRLLNEKKNDFPNITFGGCFIHQSPKVTFNMPRVGESCCELADLLVLVRKQTNDIPRYNAALIQLKKSEKSPFNLTNRGDLKQLYLFEKWPKFIMTSTYLQYDLLPKAVTQGALYCIIKRTPEFMLYMAEPMERMEYSGEMTFGRFICDTIHWQTGRTISDEANKNSDEWSRLIWDLIQNVQNKVINEGKFTRTKAGYDEANKLSNDFMAFMLKSNIDSAIPANEAQTLHDTTKKDPSIDGGTPSKEGMIIGDNEGTGISILFIDIDERKNRGELRRR